MAHRSKQIVKQLGRLLNQKVTMDVSKCSATYLLPGFKYSDFDRAGQLNIYNLNMTLEAGRLLAQRKNTVLPVNKDPNTALLMFAQRFEVYPALYDKACMDLPMIIENRILGMGRSSLVGEVTLTEQSSGEKFARLLQKLVYMDKKAKTAAPLPPNIVEFYDQFVNQEPQDVFEEIKPPKPVSKMFSTERKVQHSDMDYVFHTNQGSYMKFALDCASEAIKNGFLSAFKDDICFYRAYKAATLHMRESFAGDTLGVHVWEDSDNPLLLHFVVSKGEFKESQMIYYSFIDFSESSDESLTKKLSNL